MNRGDYITHLVLGLAFLGVLSPFLAKEGFELGTSLYYLGTTTQLALASVAHFVSGRA